MHIKPTLQIVEWWKNLSIIEILCSVLFIRALPHSKKIKIRLFAWYGRENIQTLTCWTQNIGWPFCLFPQNTFSWFSWFSKRSQRTERCLWGNDLMNEDQQTHTLYSCPDVYGGIRQMIADECSTNRAVLQIWKVVGWRPLIIREPITGRLITSDWNESCPARHRKKRH